MLTWRAVSWSIAMSTPTVATGAAVPTPGEAQRRRARVRARRARLAARDQHHRRGARRRAAGRRSVARHAADLDRRRRLAALGAGRVIVHGKVRRRPAFSWVRSPAAAAESYARAPCSSAASSSLSRARCCSALPRSQGFLRFAAATRRPSLQTKAISSVLAGRLLSALIGPEIVRCDLGHGRCLPYAGAYLAVIVLNVVGIHRPLVLDIPRHHAPPPPIRGGRWPSSPGNRCSSSRSCPRRSGSRR